MTGWSVAELLDELAVCRETNRLIHEQDTANVAKLQAIRAELSGPLFCGGGICSLGDLAPAILAILDGGGPA